MPADVRKSVSRTARSQACAASTKTAACSDCRKIGHDPGPRWWVGQRESQVGIQHRGPRPDHVVGRDTAEQTDRVAPEVERRDRRAGAGGREQASSFERAPGRSQCRATGQDSVTDEPLKAAHVEHSGGGVAIGTQRGAGRFDGGLELDAFLGADRIAELAAAVVNPAGAEQPQLSMRGARTSGGALERVRLEIERRQHRLDPAKLGGSATARR